MYFLVVICMICVLLSYSFVFLNVLPFQFFNSTYYIRAVLIVSFKVCIGLSVIKNLYSNSSYLKSGLILWFHNKYFHKDKIWNILYLIYFKTSTDIDVRAIVKIEFSLFTVAVIRVRTLQATDWQESDSQIMNSRLVHMFNLHPFTEYNVLWLEQTELSPE